MVLPSCLRNYWFFPREFHVFLPWFLQQEFRFSLLLLKIMIMNKLKQHDETTTIFELYYNIRIRNSIFIFLGKNFHSFTDYWIGILHSFAKNWQLIFYSFTDYKYHIYYYAFFNKSYLIVFTYYSTNWKEIKLPRKLKDPKIFLSCFP